MKFQGIKKDGKLVHPLAIAEAKRKFWERIPDGAEIESVITVKRRSKSQAQLGAIFGLMLAQAENELEDRGYDTSINTHPIFPRPLCPALFIYPIASKSGLA